MHILPRRIAAIVGVLLTAGYLSFFVDAHTQIGAFKRVFLFCFFALMGYIILYMARRFLGCVDSWRSLARAMAIGLALLVMLHGVLFTTIQETAISLSAIPSEDGTLREVWLVAAEADGEGIYLSQLEVGANQGWVYAGKYDDYVFYPGEEAQENYLTFRTIADEVKLYFAHNAWSGSVNIRINGSEDTALALIGAEGVNETIEHTIKITRPYVVWEYLLYGAGAWMLLSFLAAVGLELLERFFGKRGSAQKKRQTVIVIFGIAFCLISVFLFWRCKYGFANVDECFYITIPYRLWQGDAMIAHEWSMAQLSAFLMIPIVQVFMDISGSTEGIVLAFRYVFVATWCLGSLYCFLRLKKLNLLGSCLGTLVLLTYVPFGINALSYNSMGILFLTISLSTLCTAEPGQKLAPAFAGFFLAGAVLCCPYLAILYILFTIAIFLPEKLRQREGSGLLNFGTWSFLTMGVGVLAIQFLVFLFSRASPHQILDVISYILSNVAHGANFLQKLYNFIIGPYIIYRSCLLELLLWFLITVAIICFRWYKHNYSAAVLFIEASICVTLCVLLTYQKIHYINFIVMPVHCLVLTACVINPIQDSRMTRLLIWFWIPGLIYTFCLHLSSNTVSYAISSASVAAMVGGALILTLTAETLDAVPRPRHQRLQVIVALVLLCTITCQLLLRYENVFWDDGIQSQTVKLEVGPHKGTVVSPKYAELYLSEYNAVTEALDQYQPEGVVYITNAVQTMYYLFGHVKTAGPYSWFAGGDGETLTKTYYKSYPEKLPDMIYIEHNADGEFLAWLYSSDSYTHYQSEKADIYVRNNRQ